MYDQRISYVDNGTLHEIYSIRLLFSNNPRLSIDQQQTNVLWKFLLIDSKMKPNGSNKDSWFWFHLLTAYNAGEKYCAGYVWGVRSEDRKIQGKWMLTSKTKMHRASLSSLNGSKSQHYQILFEILYFRPQSGSHSVFIINKDNLFSIENVKFLLKSGSVVFFINS